ncbi:MAG: 16S rRNA (adenine(1518)-N(6)/adenine(1519)-N(6))-dimethyltransferase RsmA [Candidatus Omnitrophica bacterium]|nr:16S rRNA (adenine(1518)-N(6)/adenine(1519)-N(6))-dimethyltransferase RsmA [Candidatus Omnitrophota bacterium]
MYPKPKKRLGQNFLADKNIRKKIAVSCQLQKTDIVLEIGAGRGEITNLIAEHVDTVYAVEFDKDLWQALKDSTQGHQNIKIIKADILKLDLARHFGSLRQKIKVIGNVPYYITSPIIAHLLGYRDIIGKIFLTVQKEFALRICAKPGSKDYGSFSCFVQYYCLPRVMFSIKNTSFNPAPKVDSSFLSLEIRDQPAVKVKDEEYFFKVIRSAFNKRRKTLRNSLRETVPSEKLEKFFRNYNINANIRPEDLALSDFAHLANL